MANDYVITGKKYEIVSNGSETNPKFQVFCTYTLHNGTRSEIVVYDLGGNRAADQMPDETALSNADQDVADTLNAG
jgi:hypothetical protein